MRVVAVLILAALAGPAFGAVNKDGGKPSVNPCADGRVACAGADPQAAAEPEPQGASEPVIIYLDAEGNTLARVPLSRFREIHPDAKLPPDLDRLD